jgi:hypothetical protein
MKMYENDSENVFLNDDFCIYSVPNSRKKKHGMGFSSLQNFFFHFKSRYHFFANFVEKKQFSLPATARNSLPQESGTSQNALINPPFCGDKIFTKKR